MAAKRLRLSAPARQDIDDAIDHYFAEAGEKIASRFVEAWDAARRFVIEHPDAGSPRYGVQLGVPGLRHRRLGPYPYLIFYSEAGDHIDVWRVLHASRDIPASLQGDS